MKKQSIKILHVDDDETFIELIGIMLSEKRFNVDITKNGSEAVDLAFRGDYDIILMDVRMPLMDGREATKKIKKVLNDIPIIAVTAYDVDIYGEDSFFDDYLRKPFTKRSLHEKISKNIKK